MNVPALQWDNTITKQYCSYSPSPDSSKRTRIPPPSNSTRSDAAKNDAVRDKFLVLADQWRKETGHLSNMIFRYMNKNYQQIMTMKEDVIPIILEDMKTKPDYWFWALEMITNENPVKTEHMGRTKLMVEDWLNWGRSKGYIN